MKILMIHSDYQQSQGGENISVRAEVRCLEEAGHKVKLLTRTARAEPTLGQAGDYLFSGRSAYREVREDIRRFQPDIVHVQNLWPTFGWGALSAIADTATPYVQTVRNYRWTCLSANHFREGEQCFDCGKSSLAAKGIVRGCYRGSSVMSGAVALHDLGIRLARRAKPDARPRTIIALSHSMLRFLRQTMPEISRMNVAVNYNTVADAPSHIRGIEEREGSVWVGRLEQDKGFDLFMDAWETHGYSTGTVVTVIGDGNLRPRAELAARTWPDRFRYMGRLTNEDTLDAIGRAKVTVQLPRWEEPFGRVALECLSTGTPLAFAAGANSLKEIVGETGISLKATRDLRQLACDIAEATRSVDQTRIESVQVRYREFAPKAAGTRLERIYEQALENE